MCVKRLSAPHADKRLNRPSSRFRLEPPDFELAAIDQITTTDAQWGHIQHQPMTASRVPGRN